MSDPRFLAQLLEPSAGAYAADAAARLCDRHTRAARHGHGAWKGLLEGSVRELSAALRDGLPATFGHHAAWCREAYEARDLEPEELQQALDVLESALVELLPGSPDSVLSPYFEAARLGLRRGTDQARPPLERSTHGELARTYLERALVGDARGACALLAEACAAGVAAEDLVTEVLGPAQQEIGRRWHAGELLVAEEHLVTQTTRRALSTVLQQAPAPHEPARCVLLATVAGDEHDLGIQLLGALFELAGWHAVVLGADVPTEDLALLVERVGARVVCLSATLGRQRSELERAVQAVRRHTGAAVILGGSALRDSGDLWRELGAQAHVASLSEAVDVAQRLLA